MEALKRFSQNVIDTMRSDIKDADGNEVFWDGKIDFHLYRSKRADIIKNRALYTAKAEPEKGLQIRKRGKSDGRTDKL